MRVRVKPSGFNTVTAFTPTVPLCGQSGLSVALFLPPCKKQFISSCVVAGAERIQLWTPGLRPVLRRILGASFLPEFSPRPWLSLLLEAADSAPIPRIWF